MSEVQQDARYWIAAVFYPVLIQLIGSIYHVRKFVKKKAAHGDMSRLGGRGILIFKKHSTGELEHTIPPCGMSSIFFGFLKKKL